MLGPLGVNDLVLEANEQDHKRQHDDDAGEHAAESRYTPLHGVDERQQSQRDQHQGKRYRYGWQSHAILSRRAVTRRL